MEPIRGNGRKRLVSDINVTPLVDVMLVLLIIFMVTAPMMTQGLDVDLHGSGALGLLCRRVGADFRLALPLRGGGGSDAADAAHTATCACLAKA